MMESNYMYLYFNVLIIIHFTWEISLPPSTRVLYVNEHTLLYGKLLVYCYSIVAHIFINLILYFMV